jgi:hypothetical protein
LRVFQPFPATKDVASNHIVPRREKPSVTISPDSYRFDR